MYINPLVENYWDRRIVPDNEYYDSDEGEAQGAGGNIKSGHERDYNDEGTPLSTGMQMSQEEEEEIAKALSEEADDAVKIEQTDDMMIDSKPEQDTLMTGKVQLLNRKIVH
jgi:histone deacetylase 1/2